MTEISDLEKKYGNFYAPAFEILIDGQDIVKDKKIEIVSVSVDSTLEGASSFTFTVNNAFDITQRAVQWLDFFTFGKQVAIHMGYANSTSTNASTDLPLPGLPLVILGLITSITTNFPSEGAPQMEVSGLDLSFKLMKETKTRPPYIKEKYSDIAKSIVDDNNNSQIPGQDYLNYWLKYSTGQNGSKYPYDPHDPNDVYDPYDPLKNPSIDDSDPNDYPQIVKDTRQSDFHFLTRLAGRIYYDFFVFNKTLYFRKPVINGPTVVTLEWGKSLVSFSPKLDISVISPGVAVQSQDTDNKKLIVGIAINNIKNNNVSEAQVTELLKEVLGTSKNEDQILRVDVVLDTVYSELDAMHLAKAFLQKNNEAFLKGTGECIGIPEILAGKNIHIQGLGDRFNTTYYIERANHSISSSGYKTTFSVKYMWANTDDNIELKSGTKSTDSSGNGSGGGDGGDGRHGSVGSGNDPTTAGSRR